MWKSKIDEVKETRTEFKHMKDIKKQMHSEIKRNSWSNIKPNSGESQNITKDNANAKTKK